jgi:hypothetical protein
MSDNKIPITWQGNLIGYVQDMNVDMFHWYGKWIPIENAAKQVFLDRLEQIDEVQVQMDFNNH